MISSVLLKARAAWLFGAALIVCGLLLLLYFAALLLSQFGASGGELTASLHIATMFAVAGAVLTALGALVARGQAFRISVEKERRQDRLRRVHEYRYASRVEPYIGPRESDTGTEDPRWRR